MKSFKLLGRWTVRSLAAAVLAAGLGAAGSASAQAPRPDAAGAPKRTFTKSTVFNLPVHMEEKTRGTLDRVCLYVKAGNGDWVRQESAPPTLPYFTYRVPHDGEYWFSLVTIDKNGRAVPADVAQEQPSLKVVVDTRAPVLDVQPWTSPDGEICVRCTVADSHPDHGSLKAMVRTAAGEKLLQAHPGQQGAFKIAGHDLTTGKVAFLASDLAGNLGTRELNLRDLFGEPVQTAQALTSKTEPRVLPAPVINEGPMLPIIPPAPLPQLNEPPLAVTPPAPPSPPVLPSPVLPSPVPPSPVLPSPVTTAAVNPRSTEPTLPTPAPFSGATSSNLRPTPETTVIRIPEPTVTRPTVGSAASSVGAGVKQAINTAHAVVEYRVDQVGPSGIGKVEVFITADQGQTWQRLCEDQDRRSPVEFDLPGEGVYGIRLAITNGNGFGGAAPQRGDIPTCVVEVDTTSPFVQLRPIDPVVQNGALEIRWQASDKNLGSEPVNLYYRTRNDGPWQVIARGVKNDGAYRWNFPRDNSAQFFVKVEVADQSGNIARAESPNAVVLDTTEPRATVINVSGLSVRPN